MVSSDAHDDFSKLYAGLLQFISLTDVAQLESALNDRQQSMDLHCPIHPLEHGATSYKQTGYNQAAHDDG